MPRITAVRASQPVQSAEFVFSFDDTAVDSVTGTVKTFGSAFGDAIVFDAIPLPIGAVVVGGALNVEVAGVGPTAYTASVGQAGTPASLLAATTLIAAAGTRTPLTGLGIAHIGGANVRLTIASTVANATAGRFRLRLEFTIAGRACETLGV